MAQPTWTTDGVVIQEEKSNRLKFVIAGGLIFAAIVALVFQAISQNGQYFITVSEYYQDPAKYAERDVNLGAWVLKDSIEFTQIDAATSRLEFDVVDDLTNPTQRLRVVAMNEPIPDTMQGAMEHDVQALAEGRIGDDGVLYINPGGLLTKCPSRYEEGETQAHNIPIVDLQ